MGSRRGPPRYPRTTEKIGNFILLNHELKWVKQLPTLPLATSNINSCLYLSSNVNRPKNLNKGFSVLCSILKKNYPHCLFHSFP